MWTKVNMLYLELAVTWLFEWNYKVLRWIRLDNTDAITNYFIPLTSFLMQSTQVIKCEVVTHQLQARPLYLCLFVYPFSLQHINLFNSTSKHADQVLGQAAQYFTSYAVLINSHCWTQSKLYKLPLRTHKLLPYSFSTQSNFEH
jgi:hypothetical protein